MSSRRGIDLAACVTACSAEAALYTACVVRHLDAGNVSKGCCEPEFQGGPGSSSVSVSVCALRSFAHSSQPMRAGQAQGAPQMMMARILPRRWKRAVRAVRSK